jgi:hypothetical protein
MHDVKSSMALQAPPLISLAEITLDMPSSPDLWQAKTKYTWRDAYLIATSGHSTERTATISSYLSNITQLEKQANLDMPQSAMIILLSAWHLIWDYLQLNSVVYEPAPSKGFQGSLIASSWQHELLKLLEQLSMTFSDIAGVMRPETVLFYERMRLNLHISFEQVQLLAGKEGEEESRRVLPVLIKWSESSHARRAVWHAGQVLRTASQFTATHLCDIGAISLYHAGLTFWAYALMIKINERRQSQPSSRATQGLVSTETDLVWVDGVDNPIVQRYIALNRGTPVIHKWTGSIDDALDWVPLTASKSVMDICIQVLREKALLSAEDEGVLPMVDKLTQLMRDLGHAADGFGRA